MQETEIDIINTEEAGFIEKIKNWTYDNWQTILVVLIVLIVGMSAYNYNQNGSADISNTIAANDNSSSENEEGRTENVGANDNSNNEASTESAAENQDQNNAAKEDSEPSVVSKSEDKIADSTTITSSVDDNGKKYTVKAGKGDGVTHLARRALQEYLNESAQGSDLTSEHKIYIEDYMQNRTSSQSISVGQEFSFSEGLISDAITSAKALSQKSLQNLQKYIK